MLIQKEKLGIDGEKGAHISSAKIATKIVIIESKQAIY